MKKNTLKICIYKQNSISLQQNYTKNSIMTYQYKQKASAKTPNGNYKVMLVNNEYYQVQKNRVKISNHKRQVDAIKVMLKEAEYDILDLFEYENGK